MLGTLIKVGVDFVKSKIRDKKELKKAETYNNVQLLESKENANSRWEINQIMNKGVFIRFAALLILLSKPIAWAISSGFGQRISHAWAQMNPTEYEILMGILIGIFGERRIPSILGSIAGSIKQALVTPKR